MNKRQAIIVGVNGYRTESGLNKLKYAEQDALELAKLLGSGDYGYEVQLLTGMRATRENIMNEFVKASRTVDGDKFLFFFAGHGQSISGEYYLHPINAQIDSDIYSFRINRLLDYFQKELSHTEIIGIVDACHGEMSLMERGNVQLDPTATKDVARRVQQEHSNQNKLIKILFSCGIKQSSYEDEELNHGVLTHFLIEQMRKSGNIKSFDHMAKEMGELVPEYVNRRFRAKQSPVLFSPLTKKETWLGNLSKNEEHKSLFKSTGAPLSVTELNESGILEEYLSESYGLTSGSKWFYFYEDIRKRFEIKDQTHLRELLKIKQIEKGGSDNEELVWDDTTGTVTITKKEDTHQIEELSPQKKEKFFKEFGIDLITVRRSSFEMGSSIGPLNEQPAHKIFVSSFLMSKYPVTFKLYDKYCKEVKIPKVSDSGWGREERPVINVSWDDANKFCKWLSKKTGDTYRLPTEAEWEFAARGGKRSKNYKFSGSNDIDDIGWYKGNSRRQTFPVGQKLSNGLGIFDMSGNVCEWCFDWYSVDYYAESQHKNPTGPEKGIEKVVRGGSANFIPQLCGVSSRFKYHPKIGNYHTGFRIVKEIL